MMRTTANMSECRKILALAIFAAALLLAGGLTGCAGTRYTQSKGEHIGNRETSSRIKKALGEDTQFNYEGVKIETFKQRVQLSGFVNTRDQKNRATDIAIGVEGVDAVINNITVKSAGK